MSIHQPFYKKFIKKSSTAKVNTKADTGKLIEKHAHSEKTGVVSNRWRSLYCTAQKSEEQHGNVFSQHYTFGRPVFSDLTAESRRILEYIPVLLDEILPLDAKKKQSLPQHIHSLFHELTDERSSRKTQYLNNPIKLSAYAHYYLWWNLVRLTKLLQNLDIPLNDGDCAADFGSGPLTFICALWIAKPQLRKKKLTWFCVDLSNKALGLGEELFLALCAYTARTASADEKPWTIKKICGAFGIGLSHKVTLVTEANMFNELFWDSPLSLDSCAEKTHRSILQYLKPQGAVLCVEPGIPLAGEFLRLMRAQFLKSGFELYAPCPHSGVCCLSYRSVRGESGKLPIAAHKWCHFTFETHDSPHNLLKLSAAAQLGKERAALSFLYGRLSHAASVNCGIAPLYGSQKAAECTHAVQNNNIRIPAPVKGIRVRICSDIIKPDAKTIGRYACSEKGFMLITSPAYKDSVLNTAVSGTLFTVPTESVSFNMRDKKTYALLVQL